MELVLELVFDFAGAAWRTSAKGLFYLIAGGVSCFENSSGNTLASNETNGIVPDTCTYLYIIRNVSIETCALKLYLCDVELKSYKFCNNDFIPVWVLNMSVKYHVNMFHYRVLCFSFYKGVKGCPLFGHWSNVSTLVWNHELLIIFISFIPERLPTNIHYSINVVSAVLMSEI